MNISSTGRVVAAPKSEGPLPVGAAPKREGPRPVGAVARREGPLPVRVTPMGELPTVKALKVRTTLEASGFSPLVSPKRPETPIPQIKLEAMLHTHGSHVTNNSSTDGSVKESVGAGVSVGAGAGSGLQTTGAMYPLGQKR